MLLPKSSRKVVVETYGGLGNQILAVIFGLYCRDLCHRSLRIDITYLNRNHSPGFDFTSLFWNGKMEIYDGSKRVHIKYLWKLRDSLSFRFSMCRSLESKYLGIHREVYSRITSLDDLDQLLHNRRSVRFKGYYFQKMFAENLRTSGSLKELKIANPSSHYVRLEKECLETKPMAIHIRRGDYSKEEFGQLHENYYLRIIEDFSRPIDSPLWLFASSMEVINELPILKGKAQRIITAATLTNPAESLVLMSKCSFLLLSNSSFSYVAGLFCNGKVYTPWPLRPKGAALTPGIEELSMSDIIPNHWKTFESNWDD
jgi:hypothetical protein